MVRPAGGSGGQRKGGGGGEGEQESGTGMATWDGGGMARRSGRSGALPGTRPRRPPALTTGADRGATDPSKASTWIGEAAKVLRGFHASVPHHQLRHGARPALLAGWWGRSAGNCPPLAGGGGRVGACVGGGAGGGDGGASSGEAGGAGAGCTRGESDTGCLEAPSAGDVCTVPTAEIGGGVLLGRGGEYRPTALRGVREWEGGGGGGARLRRSHGEEGKGTYHLGLPRRRRAPPPLPLPPACHNVATAAAPANNTAMSTSVAQVR